MAIVYVFAENIRDLVLEGRREITVPENARISAAARDLIKEKQIQVNFIEPEPETIPEDNPDKKTGPDTIKDISEGPSSTDKPAENAGNSGTIDEIRAQVANAISEIGEEDIEIIIEKVLGRLQQVKQGAPQDSHAPVFEEASDDDLVICRCEEITRGEIKDAIRNGMTSLSGIKRVTRAGMGLCQGQTCQELVMRLLAEELGVKPHELEPITARGPVRPLRLDVFANS